MQEFSDKNLKIIVSPIGKTLKDVIDLVTYYYKWKEIAPQYVIDDPDKTQGGIIAQDLIKKFPKLVSKTEIDGKEYLTVDYTGLSMTLLESIKELNTLFNEQKDINDELVKQISANTKMINQINVILAAKLNPTTPLKPIVNKPIKNIKPPK